MVKLFSLVPWEGKNGLATFLGALSDLVDVLRRFDEDHPYRFQFYFFGGCLRDMIAGIVPQDVDILVVRTAYAYGDRAVMVDFVRRFEDGNYANDDNIAYHFTPYGNSLRRLECTIAGLDIDFCHPSDEAVRDFTVNYLMLNVLEYTSSDLQLVSNTYMNTYKSYGLDHPPNISLEKCITHIKRKELHFLPMHNDLSMLRVFKFLKRGWTHIGNNCSLANRTREVMRGGKQRGCPICEDERIEDYVIELHCRHRVHPMCLYPYMLGGHLSEEKKCHADNCTEEMSLRRPGMTDAEFDRMLSSMPNAFYLSGRKRSPDDPDELLDARDKRLKISVQYLLVNEE